MKMIILNQEKTETIELNEFPKLSCPDKTIILKDSEKDIILGKYGTQARAREILTDLFNAVPANEETVRKYIMPDKDGQTHSEIIKREKKKFFQSMSKTVGSADPFLKNMFGVFLDGNDSEEKDGPVENKEEENDILKKECPEYVEKLDNLPPEEHVQPQEDEANGEV